MKVVHPEQRLASQIFHLTVQGARKTGNSEQSTLFATQPLVATNKLQHIDPVFISGFLSACHWINDIRPKSVELYHFQCCIDHNLVFGNFNLS